MLKLEVDNTSDYGTVAVNKIDAVVGHLPRVTAKVHHQALLERPGWFS